MGRPLEEIAQAPSSTKEDVDRAVKAARDAFENGWGTTTPAERATAILHIADAIKQHADEITELEAANAGKPVEVFKNDEIPAMVDNLRFFAGAARCMEGKAAGEYLEGYMSIIRREPVGVIGQIAPWNYPIMMAVWKIGPALATGNTIVLKPAPSTPLSTLKLAELCAEFLPKGVLNVIAGGNDPGGVLLARRRRHGLAHRLGGDRQVDRRARGEDAQARAPRARRQAAAYVRATRARPRPRSGR
jgi:betaine-aldehyde dehydrogenase